MNKNAYRCRGTTLKHQRCKNRAYPFNGAPLDFPMYCRHHGCWQRSKREYLEHLRSELHVIFRMKAISTVGTER